MDQDRPTIRLRPNVDVSKIRHGFPWVFNNELVLDRRAKKIAAGTICLLETSDRQPLATVGFNPESRIAARVLDLNPNAIIDRDWIADRVLRALALRERIYDTPHYRMVHAEGDRLPGVVVDRFGDTVVVQPNAAWANALLDDFADVLNGISGVQTVVVNGSGRARALEGLPDERRAVIGEIPPQAIAVPMNDAIYFADIQGGQKTGLFYDQRDNHAFVAKLARDARVLDVFCHVGGFGLAAMAQGAVQATFVDGSDPALALVGQALDAMGQRDAATCVKSDAFAYLSGAQENGEKFDVVICDPPAFAPSKTALGAGLRAYEKVARLAAPLVETGGYLTLCSCSHAATVEKFAASCIRGIGRSGRTAQLIKTGYAGPDHPQHPMLTENSYLKALTFRIIG